MEKVIRHMIIAGLFLSLSLGFCVGCGSNGATIDDTPAGNPKVDFAAADSEARAEDDGLTETEVIAEFEGWWYRPEGYVSEGVSLVDVFMVDTAAGTWTAYNRYGIAQETMGCYADGDTLTLDIDILGEATFFYERDMLLGEDGNIEFVRGGPMEGFDASAFQGKWFLNGDPANDYYQLDGSSFQKYLIYMPDESYASGTWSVGDTTYTLGDGATSQEMRIDFDDPEYAFSDDYIIFQDGAAFFDDFDNVFYVHESAIGTEAGDISIATLSVALYDWNGTEHRDPDLRFVYDGTFSIIEYDTEGVGERSQQGVWTTNGQAITLTFNDGTTETAEISDDTITVAYYGMSFERSGF